MATRKRVTETAGMRIKARRNELNLTQQQIAITIGISRESIVSWEKDSTRPTGANLLKLADALDVSGSWIIMGGTAGIKTVSYIPDGEAKAPKKGRAQRSNHPPGTVLIVNPDATVTILGIAV